MTPNGISTVTFWLWGGGASGSDSTASGGGIGGHTWVVCAATNGQIFDLDVAQGGQAELPTNTYSYGASAWPNGGRGMTATNLVARIYGGGAASSVYTDTNLLAVAGGAGGGFHRTTYSIVQGHGGGTTGGDGSSTGASLPPNNYVGYGGSQSAGGDGQWDDGAYLAMLTNIHTMATAGSYMQGGNGGVATNATHTAGGGGGGYYGGGGGLKGAGTPTAIVGGGGSGYFNAELVIIGESYRQYFVSTATQEPVGSDLPFYVSGVANAPTSPNSSGGNGQITVGY